jgi:hypothetical protein
LLLHRASRGTSNDFQIIDRTRLYCDYSTEPSRPGHTFCGENRIKGADCPNCRRPLLVFFYLDTGDRRLNLTAWGRIVPLLFCWRCELAHGVFQYRVHNGAVEHLRFRTGAGDPDFPYPDYPEYFPGHTASLNTIDPDRQRIISSVMMARLKARLLNCKKLMFPDIRLVASQYSFKESCVESAAE